MVPGRPGRPDPQAFFVARAAADVADVDGVAFVVDVVVLVAVVFLAVVFLAAVFLVAVARVVAFFAGALVARFFTGPRARLSARSS